MDNTGTFTVLLKDAQTTNQILLQVSNLRDLRGRPWTAGQNNWKYFQLGPFDKSLCATFFLLRGIKAGEGGKT